MNLLQVVGFVGADPEERHTPSGQKVTTFRMGVRSYRKGKDDTIWYRVTVWGDRFDKMMPYIKKGSALFVAGEMHKDEYNDRDGVLRVGLEITADIIRFNPFPRGDRQDQAQSDQAAPGSSMGPVPVATPAAPFATAGSTPQAAEFQAAGAVDDDLPF